MRFLSILFLVLVSVHGHSQIHSGGEKAKKVKKPKPAKVQNEDTTWNPQATVIYASINPTWTYRAYTETLTDLGDRANETSRFTTGASLGARVPLGRFIGIDVSFTYFQSGEEFEELSGDSVRRYRHSYHTIATPILIQANAGSQKHQFVAGVGIAPGGLIKHNIWREQGLAQNPQASTQTSTEDLNRLQVIAIGEVGYQGRYTSRWGALVKLRYYRHLTDTYNETVPFDHKQFGVSLNLGLALYL